jgi:hypothetical protein
MRESNQPLFAPSIAALLRQERLAPLGPGQPDAALRPQLEALANDAAFSPQRIRDRGMADACRAGLWLHFDFLDEAHTISQDLQTVEGSYWHALVHRREPDFSNANYWFRRVGAHPIDEPLRRAAAELATRAPAEAAYLVRQAKWDAFAFVDLCEQVWNGRAPCEELCRKVQRVEWEMLLEHCYRAAVEQERQRSEPEA